MRGGHEAQHERRRDLAAEVEVDRADDRLDGVGEDRRLVGAARERLAATEPDERTEPDRTGHFGERDRRHETRPALGEFALVEFGGVIAEQLDRDRLTEDRVTEELESLVGRNAAVLVRERPVRERKTQEVGVEIDLQRALQLVELAFPRPLRAPLASRPVVRKPRAD